jgi:hypothetical protein
MLREGELWRAGWHVPDALAGNNVRFGVIVKGTGEGTPKPPAQQCRAHDMSSSPLDLAAKKKQIRQIGLALKSSDYEYLFISRPCLITFWQE